MELVWMLYSATGLVETSEPIDAIIVQDSRVEGNKVIIEYSYALPENCL